LSGATVVAVFGSSAGLVPVTATLAAAAELIVTARRAKNKTLGNSEVMRRLS
jgi:hypothetical protein